MHINVARNRYADIYNTVFGNNLQYVILYT